MSGASTSRLNGLRPSDHARHSWTVVIVQSARWYGLHFPAIAFFQKTYRVAKTLGSLILRFA